MEAILKGIVSDHWSNVIRTVTFIGFGIKIPANLVSLFHNFEAGCDKGMHYKMENLRINCKQIQFAYHRMQNLQCI